MSTLADLPATRRTATGLSATAQGADGTTELVRTALAALLASPWAPDPSAPSIPVHAYARPAPSGDAYAACYGYDATTRTQRAAMGAVCYTLSLPSASGQTIDALRATVSGDRYLERGVDIHVTLSSDAEPPDVSALAARTPDATLCATGDQTAAPNDRVPVVAQLALADLGAAAAYLHIALLLHDPSETARGAWIEGGAMLDPATIELDYSGTVTPPPPAATLLRPIYAPSGVADNPYLVRQHILALDSDSSTTEINAALGTIADGSAALASSQLGAPAEAPRGWSKMSFDHGALWAGVITGNELWLVCTSPLYDARDLRAGRTISLPLKGSTGLTIRAVLVDMPSAADEIDWSDATILGGSSPRVLGAVEFALATGSENYAYLTLLRSPASPFVALLLYPIAATGAGLAYAPPAVLPVA